MFYTKISTKTWCVLVMSDSVKCYLEKLASGAQVTRRSMEKALSFTSRLASANDLMSRVTADCRRVASRAQLAQTNPENIDQLLEQMIVMLTDCVAACKQSARLHKKLLLMISKVSM